VERERGRRNKKAEDQSSLCGVCKRNCDIDCVCCDLYDTWYHFGRDIVTLIVLIAISKNTLG
jgi:hypothetical protein